MKRTVIAVGWIVGTTIPSLAALVFLFGCCVLPFHRYIHRAMPLCRMAVHLMEPGHDVHHRDAGQTLPARQRQEPAPRIVTTLPRSIARASVTTGRHTIHPITSSGSRSVISLGALRCDQDVGLHLLDRMLLI